MREKGWVIGLVSEKEYNHLLEKKRMIQEEIERVCNTFLTPSEKLQAFLNSKGSTELKSGISVAELIKRPELSYFDLQEYDLKRPDLPFDVQEQVNIQLKYEGYIKRQIKQVEQFKKLENKKIPEDIHYDEIKSLRLEALQKLKKIRPVSIGQASRISGVSPADISVLLVYLESKRK